MENGGPAPTPAEAALERKAKEAAEKFEAHFIAQMLHQMRRSTREFSGENGLFRDKASEDMLDMTDTMLADAMAGRHAFGIADLILRQLLPSRPAAVTVDEKASFNLPPRTVALDK